MRVFILIIMISFITGLKSFGASYCIPAPTSGINGFTISAIRLRSLNDTGFVNIYNNYSDSLITTTCYLVPGATYKIFLTNGSHAVVTMAAWADWNNDTTFSNTTEKLGEKRTTAALELDSLSFTVPSTTFTGKVRLRVRISNSTAITACTNYTSGQTMDFTITVLNTFYEFNFFNNWQFASAENDFIDSVGLANLSNPHTGGINGPLYCDYSAMRANIVSCNSYYLYITGNISSADDSIKAFIDYNNDGYFELNELIGDRALAPGVHTDSISITPPGVTGTFRLRILNFRNDSISEVEDYSVNIIAGTSVYSPTALIGSDLFYECDTLCYFTGCPGQCTFHDYTCGQPATRHWTIPGASPSTSTVKNPVFTFTDTGYFNITLIDSNSAGIDTAHGLVYISPPVTNVHLGNNVTLCNGDSIQLSAPAANPLTECFSYLWSTGSTARQIYVHTSGTYSVQVNSCHHTDCPAFDTIVVNFSPQIFNVNGGGGYCTGGTGSVVGLNNSESGISYQLFLNGNPVGTPVIGTGNSISFGHRTGTGAYTVVATNSTISCTASMSGHVNVTVNPLPGIFNVNGGGHCCASSPGVAVGINNSELNVNYQLYVNGIVIGTPVAGTGSSLNFPNHATAGNYTVVATSSNGACTNTMTGSATITTIPGPHVYTITGGGSFCGGTPGTVINLSNSQSGVTYELFRNGTTTGTILNGNDSAINFPPQLHSGTYTIIATNDSSCSATMTGNAVLTISPTPTPFALAGGGIYCVGDSFAHITLSSSETGVRYQLYCDTNPVGNSLNGTGNQLDFGAQSTPGTYTVIGSNTVSICHLQMSGSPVIIINPLPVVYNVTGGGHYCLGSSGIAVGLNNSDTSAKYQLYRNNNPVGGLVSGNGSSLNFGLQSVVGSYTVIATSNGNTCSAPMNDTAKVTVDSAASPVVYHVTGGGHYCVGDSGVFIGLNNSDTAFQYQLYHNNVATGSPVLGTGTALNLGLQTLSGNYTVTAQSISATCTAAMTGSASIFIDALPVPHITSALPDTICIYHSPVALTGSPAGGIFQGDGITGDSLIPVLAGAEVVHIIYHYTDSVTGCSASVSDSVTVDLCSGIDEYNLAGSISLFPNPANTEVVINLPPMKKGSLIIEIINNLGQVVKTIKTSTNNSASTFIIKTTDIVDGIYIVKFNFNYNFISKRLQINH